MTPIFMKTALANSCQGKFSSITNLFIEIFQNSYDTLLVNVESGGQNWPNIKWALQGFSGLLNVFYGIYMA